MANSSNKFTSKLLCLAYSLQFMWFLRMFCRYRRALQRPLVKLEIPVGRTIVIHVMMGSVQKSLTCVAAWPKQNEMSDNRPKRTVVSRCFIPLPNKWHIYSRDGKMGKKKMSGCHHVL